MGVNNQLNMSAVPLAVASGGLGVASHVAYTPLCGGTTSTGAVQSVASLGTTTDTLQSMGASALPEFLGSDWQFIQKSQANNIASADFINLSTDYIAYKFLLSYINPVTDGVNLQCRVSTNNGSTWISSASSYYSRWSVLGTTFANGDITDTYMIMSTVTGNTSPTEYCLGEVTLLYPADSGSYTTVVSRIFNITSAGVHQNYINLGRRLNAEANDGFQFYFSSGNLASVDIVMYGMLRT